MTPHTNKCVHKNWPTDQPTKPPFPSCHSDDRREEDVLLNEVKNLVYIHVYIHISTPFMHPRSFTALRSVLDDKTTTPPFVSSWAKRRICLHPLTLFRSFTALRSVQDDKAGWQNLHPHQPCHPEQIPTRPVILSEAKDLSTSTTPQFSNISRLFFEHFLASSKASNSLEKRRADWSVGQFYIRRASHFAQNFYLYI